MVILNLSFFWGGGARGTQDWFARPSACTYTTLNALLFGKFYTEILYLYTEPKFSEHNDQYLSSVKIPIHDHV